MASVERGEKVEASEPRGTSTLKGWGDKGLQRRWEA